LSILDNQFAALGSERMMGWRQLDGDSSKADIALTSDGLNEFSWEDGK